jgi:sterol desaturase/sphingolipid hydroxylase (fatty acid hydroxylase superfamily)
VLHVALATLLSLLALAVAFVPLERAFPARRQPILRPGLGVDLAFFAGQYVVWSGLAVAVLVAVRAAIDAQVAPPAMPLAARVVLAVVAGDLLVYGFHRACHAVPWLWRFHAVHHSSEHLDWLAAHREHPVDGVCTQLAQNLPAFFLGLPFEAVAGLVAVRGMWSIFIHSNVRLPLGPLRILMGAPDLHHWHHARVAETRHNFANLAPWIDWVLGTYHRPRGDENWALGLGERFPRSYLGQLAAPFRLSRSAAPGSAPLRSAPVPRSR